MSGDILEQKQHLSQDLSQADHGDQPEKKAPAKKNLFGNLNKDLKDALSSWDSLTAEMSKKVPPDEQQLQEVKKILGELKAKLNEFEE